VFDADIDDPTGSLAGLSIDGNPGISWERDDPLALRVSYFVEIIAGEEWANTDGAGGIVGADGGMLQAGSGLVQPE
jgi:hypothetical protein